MITPYQIYQAEHPRSVAQQRDEARRNGELALALARLLHRRRSPAARRAPLETCG